MASEAASKVAQIALQASSSEASAELRRLAAQYSEELKLGSIALSVSTAAILVDPSAQLEVQHFGYGVLHHLVKFRWPEFDQQEQTQLYGMAWGWLQQATAPATPWAIRSKSALLMAEIVRQAGSEVWDPLLPALTQLAEGGPGAAVSALMVLRHVTEDVTVFSDDLEGAQKRKLLHLLNDSMPQVLPFIVKMLESHYVKWMEATRGGQADLAQRHALVVQEGLEAAASCAGVVPVTSLLQHRVIDAAAFLLRSQEFCMPSLDVLRKIVARKAAEDEREAFAGVCSALTAAASGLLGDAWPELGSGGFYEELAQRLCDTMAEFGGAHLETLAGQPVRAQFLEHMVRFAQHPDLILSGIALGMWNTVMGKVTAPKKGSNTEAYMLPAELVVPLMASVPERMAALPQGGGGGVPDAFLSAKELKEFSSTYRAKLSKLVKDLGSQQPATVLSVCTEQLSKAAASGSATDIEVLTLMLEPALSSFPAEFMSRTDTGMLQLVDALIGISPSPSPTVAALHGRCLEATAAFLKHNGERMQEVVSKVISILLSVPLMASDGWELPPISPPTGWRDAFATRVKLAGNVLGIAKVAGAQLASHLQALSSYIQGLWQRREIRVGERNVLQEALLVAGLNVGPELQAQLIEWLLAPIRDSWRQQRRLQSVSSAEAFLREFAELPSSGGAAAESPIGGREARWEVHHEMQMVERAVRRTPPAGQHGSQEPPGQMAPADPRHPALPHADWAFTVPLRLLWCMQALWQPQWRAALGPAQAALEMCPAERQVYLGQLAGRQAREAGGEGDSEESVAGGSVTAFRMWLKAMRDSVYLLIAMAVEHVPGLFARDSLAEEMGGALTAHIEFMAPRHLRLMLRHSVIPLVRECPRPAWGQWLSRLLPPLLPVLRGRLTAFWGAFSAAGTGAAGGTTEDTSRAQDEVVEERVMRELSREAAVLMQILAGMQTSAKAAGAVLPPRQVDQPGAGVQGCILEWLLDAAPPCAEAVVRLSMASMAWPDSDAAHRGMSTCRAVAAMASGRPDLEQVVGSEMLQSAILGLTLDSNTVFQGELITLIREILVQHPASSAAARGVLMSLPRVSENELQGFYEAFAKEASEKEQRLLIKRLLVGVGGEHLKALSEWRNNPGTVNVKLSGKNQAAPQRDDFELSVDWSDISNPRINN